jgi:exonuclease VII small subunit
MSEERETMPEVEATVPTDDGVDAEATEADEVNPDDADATETDDDETEGEDAEADDQSDEDEGEGESDESEDDDKAGTDADLIEVQDAEGRTHKIPKALEGQFLMQRDYTQKTQQVAEERKAVSQLRASVEQWANASQELRQADSHFQAAKAQYDQIVKTLDEYARVDWQALKNSDYDQYERASEDLRTLQLQERQARQQVEQIGGHRQQAAKKIEQARQQELQTRIKTIHSEASRDIPNFNDEIDAKVTNYMRQTGADEFWMAQHLTPALYKAAWKAMQYDEMQAKAKEPRPKPKAAKALKPTATVKSKSGPSARKDPSSMTMEEYAAHMNRKEAAARNRKYA